MSTKRKFSASFLVSGVITIDVFCEARCEVADAGRKMILDDHDAKDDEELEIEFLGCREVTHE